MTPAQFSAALAALGWSQRHLASLLACDSNLPTRWSTGRAVVPPQLARWLDALAYQHKKLPPPTDWRSRYDAAKPKEK